MQGKLTWKCSSACCGRSSGFRSESSTACSGLRRPTRPIRIGRGGEGWRSLQGSLEAGFAAQLGLSIGKWSSACCGRSSGFRSESSTACSGLRRPSRPIPIHGQRPAAGVRAGRVVSGLRFAVNFLTSLHKSLSPTAKRCFHRMGAGDKQETNKLRQFFLKD